MSSEDSSASLFKRLWRPSVGAPAYTGGIAGNGLGGTLPAAAPPPRSIKTSSVMSMPSSSSNNSNVPHSSALSMPSKSKAHPPAPVRTQAAPGSPISHPEMCFSPTDVGIWEVERPKSSGGTRGANFSVGGSGGGSGTGPRGFFSSILGGGSGGGGGAGGGSGGGETK